MGEKITGQPSGPEGGAPKSEIEKELSPQEKQEKLETAKEFLEQARTSIGRARSDVVFECQGNFMDARLGPEDLHQIGTSREELDELLFQGTKEGAQELLEKARSSRGQERLAAAGELKSILELEAAKREGVKSFGPEDIGTTKGELDELFPEEEQERGGEL